MRGRKRERRCPSLWGWVGREGGREPGGGRDEYEGINKGSSAEGVEEEEFGPKGILRKNGWHLKVW